MAEYKRKKIYLGWELHGRIVARVLAYWVCYHLVLWGGIFAYQYLSYRSATYSSDSNVAYNEFIASFLNASIWFLIYALTVGAAITWDITRITHRIVGPLKRVESTLERLTAGEPVQAIKFRKGDLIPSLEQAFNKYLTSLNAPYQTTLSQAQQESAAVRDRAEALQNAPIDAAPDVEDTLEATLAAARAFHQRLRALNASDQPTLSEAQRQSETVRDRSAHREALGIGRHECGKRV